MNWLNRIRGARDARRDTTAPSPVASAADGAGSEPGAAEALFEAGRSAFRRGDYDAAARDLSAALDAAHDHAKAHYYLGLTRLNQQRHEEAADCFTMALHFKPDYAEAFYNLGLDARRRGDYVQAAADFQCAVELKPAFAQAHNNLGYTLFADLGDCERGAAHIETALRLQPDDPDVLCNQSAVLLHRDCLDEAIALCDRLLASHPELHEARLNRALAELKQGRFAQGWRDYEARRKAGSTRMPEGFGLPEWQGEPISGKSVLVYAEQGLGDQLMFASCMPDLMRQAAHCVIVCAPQLQNLLRRSFAGADVYAAGDAQLKSRLSDATIDFQIAIGSLPRLYRPDLAHFPPHHGYLRGDAARAEHWRRRLERLGRGLKIGISWRGGAVSTRGELRSSRIEEWLPLLRRENCRFVSLQYGDADEEVSALRREHAIRIEHWRDAIDDYDETAALVCALDLVITVQTAVVHLAGALGRPAWVMVPPVAEWRYMQHGESMPWYPTVRVFRRDPAGWRPLIERVARELPRPHPER